MKEVKLLSKHINWDWWTGMLFLLFMHFLLFIELWDSNTNHKEL